MITKENIKEIVRTMDLKDKKQILDTTTDYVHIECGTWGVKAEPTDDNDSSIRDRLNAPDWSGEEYLVPRSEIVDYLSKTNDGDTFDFGIFLRTEPHGKHRIHNGVAHWMLDDSEINSLYKTYPNLRDGSLVLIKVDMGYLVFSNEVTNMKGVYSSAKPVETFEDFRKALGIEEA